MRAGALQHREGVRRRRPAASVAACRAVRVGAGAVAAGIAVVAVARHVVRLSIDPRASAVVVAAMAAALMVALTLVSFLSWRLAADRRSLYISAACLCYAVFPLVLGVVAPSVSDPSRLAGSGAAFQLAGCPAVVVFGLAARRTSARGNRRARTVLAMLMLATSSTAAVILAVPGMDAIDVVPGVPARVGARVAFGAIALAWAAVTVAHALALRRRVELPSWAWTVAAAGISVAYALGAAPGAWAHATAWSVMSAALVAGLWGAAIQLQRHHAAEQRDLRDAVVRAAVATSRAQSIDDSRAELRHDARAALLGIEAAARGLSHHRDLLTAEEWDELSHSLVAEVHRLGSLLDDRVDDGTEFDLREVVTPVIACGRADGLEIALHVPAGIAVAGSRDGTAHALLSLLDNARSHAPGSPVVVQAVVGPDAVTVHVGDRGPGVPAPLRATLFDRGVRAPSSTGSGLGLFVARRIVSGAGGAIWCEPRRGGGSWFVVRLRRAAPAIGDAPTSEVPAASDVPAAGNRRVARPAPAAAGGLTAVS